ncbi:MAG: hypothetical protein AB9873_16170 [Syntrophobacteraceae bacterium]
MREKVDAIRRSESRRVFATLIPLRGEFELAEEALQSVRSAATLRWQNDKVSIADGPYAETKDERGAQRMKKEICDGRVGEAGRHDGI